MVKNYTIINGDTTYINTIEENTIDVSITSPPYNLSIPYDTYVDDIEYKKYLEFTKKWLYNVYFWTKSTGRLCINIPLEITKGGKHPIYIDVTRLAQSIGWKYHASIIWHNGNISKRTAWGSFMSASAPHSIIPVEMIVILYKDVWKRDYKGTSTIPRNEFIEYTNGLWRFNGARKNGHPAPFPVELSTRLIKLFTYREDVILDPFMGSGTALISAVQNKRMCIGIELSKKYCELAARLIEKNKYIQEKIF